MLDKTKRKIVMADRTFYIGDKSSNLNLNNIYSVTGKSSKSYWCYGLNFIYISKN